MPFVQQPQQPEHAACLPGRSGTSDQVHESMLSLSALAAVCSRSALAWPVAAFMPELLLLLLVLLVRPHLQWLTGSGMCKGSLEGCSPAPARAGVPAFCLQCLRDAQVGRAASAASRPVAFCKRREHGMDGRPPVRALGVADAPDTSHMLAVRPDSTIKGDTRSTTLQSVKACQCL